jgi:exonuclease III
MSFGTWNVRSLYRSGSLMTVARELAKYKLDLVGVQEVRWDKEGTVIDREHIFSMAKGRKIID